MTLEAQGVPGDGTTDAARKIEVALSWSAANRKPVYAFNEYFLDRTISFPANATLIATPTARFFRGFGTPTNDHDDAGNALVSTDGDQRNIRIEGGIWGMEVDRVKVAITFTKGGSGVPNTISFPGARDRYFDAAPPHAPLPGVIPQVWIYKRDDHGDYDPAIPNNNRIFNVLSTYPANPDEIYVDGDLAVGGPVANMFASYVPLAGNGFKVESAGGVIDGVGLINPRGIQFQLRGDSFLITRCWSRNATPDAGGGVRFNAGHGMRGTLLDLETSDDCFQFVPVDNDDAQETVTRSSFVDCIGRTNQGALIAFLNGGGSTYGSADSATTLTDCYAGAIRGRTGGPVIHGGIGIKVWCERRRSPSSVTPALCRGLPRRRAMRSTAPALTRP